MDPDQLRSDILARLSEVIDPETGVDVVRMRLIEDLEVDESGHVAYKFRPSSPLCPIAVPLADAIRQAVGEVKGVRSQDLEIVGYLFSEDLTLLIKQAMDKAAQKKK
jgi:metal-sulfur cluster biosynthetic enzyme